MRKVVQSSKPFFALLFSIVIAMMAISPPIAYATEESNESKHYLGTVVNAGHDTGFSENNAISENDPHFGWKLGEFYVNGYTRVTEDKRRIGGSIMQELKFRDDPAAMERLMNAQNAIDEYVSSHPKKLSETERDELGELLKERAAALSEATDFEVHSIVD